MTNLKDVLAAFNVTGYGFEAVRGLTGVPSAAPFSSGVAVSTLPASVMAAKGIKTYFAPQFERGQVFETTEDLIEANVPVKFYAITDGTAYEETVIVSRHPGTVEVLKSDYPEAIVFTGNVDAASVLGKHVVGTLPPHLVSECALYTHVSIKDFDYAKDGDISGVELVERLQFNDPIGLELIDVIIPKAAESISDLLRLFGDDMSLESPCIELPKAEELGYPLQMYLGLDDYARYLGFKTFSHCEKYEYYTLVMNPDNIDDYVEFIRA